MKDTLDSYPQTRSVDQNCQALALWELDCSELDRIKNGQREAIGHCVLSANVEYFDSVSRKYIGYYRIRIAGHRTARPTQTRKEALYRAVKHSRLAYHSQFW